jgi:hypothetical protein
MQKIITLSYMNKKLNIYCERIEHKPTDMRLIRAGISLIRQIKNVEEVKISGINIDIGIDAYGIKKQHGAGILSFTNEDNQLIEFHINRVHCINERSMIFYASE